MAHRNASAELDGPSGQLQVKDDAEVDSETSPRRTPSTKIIQTPEMPPSTRGTAILRRISTLFGIASPVKEAREPLPIIDEFATASQQRTNRETPESVDEEAFAEVHQAPSSSHQIQNPEETMPKSATMAGRPEPSKTTDEHTANLSRSNAEPDFRQGRKRKADVERPDLYDIDEAEDHGMHFKDSTQRTKRRRPAPKAKESILQSKATGRQTRAGIHEGDKHGGSTNAESGAENVQRLHITNNNEQSKAKRGRGRPKRNPPKVDTAVSLSPHQEIPVTSSPEHNKTKSIERRQIVTVEIPSALPHNFLDDSASDTGLFMNPSPIKAIPPKVPIFKVNSQLKQPGERAAPIPDLSDDSEDEIGMEDDLELDESGWLIKDDFLLEMLSLARQVGTSKKRGDNGEGVPVLKSDYTKQLHTRNAGRMRHHVNNLSSAYNKFKRTRSSGNDDALLLARQEIVSIIASLEEEVQSIMETRLGDLEEKPQERKRMKTMLRDLYFHVIPDLLSVIVKSAAVNPLHISTDTESLQEIASLLEMAHTLAERARAIPDTHQPKTNIPKRIRRVDIPSSIQTFASRKLIRSLVPKLWQAKKKIHEELDSRQYRAMQAEREKRNIAIIAKRAEKERIQRIERQREDKDRKRRQAKDFQRYRNDPLYQILFRGESRTVAAQRRTMSQSSSFDDWTHSRSHSRETSHPNRVQENARREYSDTFDDEDDYERVSVFGSHNTKQVSHSRPWSQEERCTFVEYMRRDESDDRYAKVADALDRSLDDVFEYAKDFQEAMDHENANHRLGKPWDEWTYTVWRGPR